MRVSLAVLATLTACASRPPSPAAPLGPPPPAPPSTVATAPAPAAPAASSPAVAQPAPPRTLAEETRATLDQLVAVDTSHGHETDALTPIAERLRPLMPVELVESAPGRGNLVARYKGSGAKRPLLLIAHVDVVPTEGQPWTVPPFQITEKDGFLWGRGVNDDKGMAAAIVAVAVEMGRTRPALSRDVIFALTAGEEMGGYAGVQWLAKNRKDLLDAEIALNEGGGGRLSDDGERVVEVGLGAAEKTFQSYRFVVHGRGGHSSVPPTDSDPVLTLSRALVKVGEFRFPAHVIAAARDDLAADAKLQKAPLSEAEARVVTTGKVSDEDERVLAKDPVVNAHLRTTCVTTQLLGSPQDNVLPTTAEATVNCRVLPDETREHTLATLQRIVGDPKVEIVAIGDFGYGPYSPPDADVTAAFQKAAATIWPGAPVVSTMSTGATDSRHLRALGVRAYGMSVSPTSRPEGLSSHVMHGPDERRPAKWLGDGARLLRDVTYELAR
jgi:acetylornithine deacetylase/succinyl-diaminopimelate desuccinylase-like protein